jgi:membrane associated rhomboid family serine protease
MTSSNFPLHAARSVSLGSSGEVFRVSTTVAGLRPLPKSLLWRFAEMFVLGDG